MSTIIGDLFKDLGKGVGKVFDGDIFGGIGDVIGGTLKGTGRTVGFAGRTIGELAEGIGELTDVIFDDGEVSDDELTGLSQDQL